ncbi:MAG: GPW/gp25 family protein [Flavobacteriales bacterium]|nr:GPW/gp25 family protein [Flavobacteriales bacterium]
MAIDDSFLGRGWSFPPTFNNTTTMSVEMVEKEQDIQQSLEILLNTTRGERIMLPGYGCDLMTFLFESVNDSKMHLLKEIIRSAIITYEPRIELNDVIVDYSDYLDGIIRIQLDYTITTTNTRFNLVFPYYKVEGTNIPQLYHKQITQSIVAPDESVL